MATNTSVVQAQRAIENFRNEHPLRTLTCGNLTFDIVGVKPNNEERFVPALGIGESGNKIHAPLY
jgi:hypothetical protein